MLVLSVVLVVGTVVAAYWALHRPALAHQGGSAPAAGREFRPSTSLGWASVWVLAAAVVAQLSTTSLVIWGGAPFAAVAFVLALVAMVRHHDRGLLLWMPVVGGLFVAAFPFLMWLGG